MNKTLVATINNANIYLVNDDKIPFYICIPTTEINSASMLINILDNPNEINPSLNNIEQVKNKVVEIYQNYKGYAIVTPLIDGNLAEQLNLNANEKIYNYIDKVISYLINQSYKLLTSENIAVNKIIKYNINNKYSTFNSWFIKKYAGRVEPLSVQPTIAPNNLGNVKQEQNVDPEAQKIANEVLNDTNAINTIKDENNEPEERYRELGFVSYVLLGVLVTVISLVILYMLL